MGKARAFGGRIVHAQRRTGLWHWGQADEAREVGWGLAVLEDLECLREVGAGLIVLRTADFPSNSALCHVR